MKSAAPWLTAGFLLSLSLTVTATTLYVDLNNPAPVPPYTNWVTAATNIQDAVDAAVGGDQVLVTNGVYATSATVIYGMSNRVAVTKAVTLQSVNGPEVTIICGNGPRGSAAIRCAYLTNGVVLAGFTLTNGATRFNDSGDPEQQKAGGGVWCEPGSVLISNCVLVGNSALYYGGGTYRGTVINCTLTGNLAGYGGGASDGTLSNCTLTANMGSFGGGAYNSTLNNCTLSGNLGSLGGGAAGSTLNNCPVYGNSVSCGGGGGLSGVGGGTYNSTANNCTVTGNWACDSGGGAYRGTLNDCVIYYNTAGSASSSNYFSSTLNSCWTTEPQLASVSHLSASSPCRGAGSFVYTNGVDIDGEPWANAPSIGCDEYWSGSVTGALSATIVVDFTNVPAGATVNFQAVTAGRVSGSSWDFGGGVVLSNRPYASHAWAAAGDYPVVLRAYNETYPDGVPVTIIIHVVREFYVALDNTSPMWPYGSWATAATNIQDAVDVARAGDLVLVSNGVYQTGGRVVYGISNRVAVTKPVTVRSVNGPAVTTIRGKGPYGYQAVRCVYLTNDAVLAGFTLTNGATVNSGDPFRQQSGGGVWCESGSCLVSNCLVTGNGAYLYGGGAHKGTLRTCTLTANSAAYGGGAYSNSLTNCTVTGNWVGAIGGGCYASTLNNCMVTSNSAYAYGGGAYQGTLENCIVRANSAAHGGGAYAAALSNATLSANRASYGGGAQLGVLNNCTLTGNSATNSGGGACACSLTNCVVTANAARVGGGAASGMLINCSVTANSATNYGGGTDSATLGNCIVYYNTGPDANYSGGALNSCCTTPLPGGGTGNFTNAPLFVDQAGGDLHLQTNSPCINAGLNAYAPGTLDLDGNPRIGGGTVDVGAYEFQSPASRISYIWLQQYGLPTDGSADYADPDADRMNNWQEWVAGTEPTNAASVLRLQAPVFNPPGLLLRWSSDASRTYFVQCATNLASPLSFTLLRGDIPGLSGTTTYADTNVFSSKAATFYRVGTADTNAASSILLQPPVCLPASVTLIWLSVTNRAYFLERATNLAPPAFTLLQSNIPGLPDTTSFTDTNPPPCAPAFYRVGVQP